MTRGKIIYIDQDESVYCTCEFNGDMYPDGNADEILERFEDGYFENQQYYERFVERFNKRHYGYEEKLIQQYYNKGRHIIDVTENWTDYLYIINESGREWTIKSKDGSVSALSGTLAIVCFQQVENVICKLVRQKAEKTVKLTKAEFTEVLKRLQETSDLVEQVNTLFRNSRDNTKNDFHNAAGLQISHESIVIMLLKKLLNDKYEWIEYFIYDLDYGRKYEPGRITDGDGNDIDISTADKLYDYITLEADG